MTQETVTLSGAVTVDRDLAAGVPIVAASNVPAEGPWNSMLRLAFFDVAHPEKTLGGRGVEIQAQTAAAGTYRITVTPDSLPFAGTLKIG